MAKVGPAQKGHCLPQRETANAKLCLYASKIFRLTDHRHCYWGVDLV